jgi:hypothetical protein
MKNVVFTVVEAKRLKIIYKNGKPYTVKNPLAIKVFQNKSGGHDIEYTLLKGDTRYAEFGTITNPATTYHTNTDDVVAIELENAALNGVVVDRVKKSFKNGA